MDLLYEFFSEKILVWNKNAFSSTTVIKIYYTHIHTPHTQSPHTHAQIDKHTHAHTHIHTTHTPTTHTQKQTNTLRHTHTHTTHTHTTYTHAQTIKQTHTRTNHSHTHTQIHTVSSPSCAFQLSFSLDTYKFSTVFFTQINLSRALGVQGWIELRTGVPDPLRSRTEGARPTLVVHWLYPDCHLYLLK